MSKEGISMDEFSLQDIDDPVTKRFLQAIGYCGLFADRETTDEAIAYVENIGKSCDAVPHVTTAVMVYVNTLLKQLVLKEYILPHPKLLEQIQAELTAKENEDG